MVLYVPTYLKVSDRAPVLVWYGGVLLLEKPSSHFDFPLTGYTADRSLLALSQMMDWMDRTWPWQLVRSLLSFNTVSVL